MRAKRVVELYNNGERNFRRINLRGQSLKGKNLSGADFSGADLRGTDFSYSILRGANFTGSKTGLRRFWTICSSVLWTLIFLGLIISFLDSKLNIGVKFIQLFFIVLIAEILFLEKFDPSWTDVKTSFRPFDIENNVSKKAKAIILIPFLFFSISLFYSFYMFLGKATFWLVIRIQNYIVSQGVNIQVFSINSEKDQSFTIGSWYGIGICALLYITIGSKFFLWHTSYQNSDLTDANFNTAILTHTDFRKSNFTRVCLIDSKIYHCKFEETQMIYLNVFSDLSNRIRTHICEFDNLNLEYINLSGADLSDVSFIGTDLSQANLKYANLSGAKLVRTRLDKADLSNSCLTGAYIEDWIIKSTTGFRKVECKYIYLKLPENNGDPNRVPPLSQGDFREGDFEVFITSILDTLDLYHKQKINVGVAVEVLKSLTQDYPVDFELVELANRGNGQFLIKLKVSGPMSHSQIESEYYTRYEQVLPVHDPRKLLGTDAVVAKVMEEIQKRPGTYVESFYNDGFYFSGGSVMHVDQSRNVNVGGSLDVKNSIFNLGDISSGVTNTINEIPDDNQSNLDLKALLTQLQEVIESDTDLSSEDKIDLLDQIKILIEAGRTSEQEKKEGLVRKARKVFEATLKSLPDTARIVEASSKLLPMILKVIGISV